MKKNMYVVLFLAALLMTSCINTKRIVYLEDMKEDISYPMNQQPEMRIQRDDRISIVVNSRNPELTVPFNISTVGNFQVTSNGDVAVTGNNQKQEKGYTVNVNNIIFFPYLTQAVNHGRSQHSSRHFFPRGYTQYTCIFIQRQTFRSLLFCRNTQHIAMDLSL